MIESIIYNIFIFLWPVVHIVIMGLIEKDDEEEGVKVKVKVKVKV